MRATQTPSHQAPTADTAMWTRDDVAFISHGKTCAAWHYRPWDRADGPLVVIAHGFEIEQQWRRAVDTQCRGCEQGAFEAMRRSVAQYAARRANGFPIGLVVVADFGIQKMLDAFRRLQRPECAQLGRVHCVRARV